MNNFSQLLYAIITILAFQPRLTASIRNDGVCSPQVDKNRKMSKEWRSKFFFPYLVEFPNDPCNGEESDDIGLCLSKRECEMRGGTKIGSCADQIGTCCKVYRSCEGDDFKSTPRNILVGFNYTYMQSNAPSSCNFTLPKAYDVCQVLLNFIKFDYGETDGNGDCSEASITISGATNVPQMTLCGSLTNQHMYLNYGPSSAINIDVEAGRNRDGFSILVTYIPCSSSKLVPKYCTQYFTQATGTVTSFNWPRGQLNNQDYTVCVADPHEKNPRLASQQLSWTTCEQNGRNDSFFISGTRDERSPEDSSNHEEETCKRDFVDFYGGERQCGKTFVDQTLSSGPYLLRVRFDETEIYSNSNLKCNESDPMTAMCMEDKPPNGCESLNMQGAVIVMCKDIIIFPEKCFCVECMNAQAPIMTTNDRYNTGFCLTYKIMQT